MSKRFSSIAGNAVALSFYVFIGRITGFVREILISYLYGNSSMSDAYIVSNSLATVLFNGLFFGIMTAYIPICSTCSKKEKNQLTSNIINLLFLFMVIAIVTVFFFNEKILSLFTMGFDTEAKHYTSILSKYAVGSAIFSMILNVTVGYLNAESSFSFGGFHGMITNIIMCITLIFTISNPHGLGIGYIISIMIPAILGIFLLKKNQFNYSLTIKYDKNTRDLLVNAIPAFLGTNIIQLNVMIDKAFASTLGVGVVSALNYADLLCAFVINVIATSVATVIFTSLSELATKNKNEDFANELVKGIKLILLVLIPITICFSILSPWMIDLLFGRGKFDLKDIRTTAESLEYYAFSIIGTALNQIVYRAFFSKRDNVTPFVCYTIGIVVNIVMNFILIKNYGHMGLAMATSISSLVIFVVQLILFDKKYRFQIGRRISGYLARIMACGMAMYISVSIIKRNVKIGTNVSKWEDFIMLFMFSSFGCVIYFGLAYFIKIKEIKDIVAYLKRKR